MIGYYIVKLFSKLLCVAPPWLYRFLGRLLGAVAILVTPAWRIKMAEANIKECLGVDSTRAYQIADASLRRFGRMVVEVLRFPTLSKDNIDAKVRIEGIEYLEASYAQGRGVIMATGHYGNWELLGATVALKGYPMLSITRRQNNGYMDRLINELRQMVGQQVTYNKGEHGLLAISRMLKEKKLLGVLYDQDTNKDGITVDLLGKKSVVPMGAAALSRIYGSPILPIFLHNNEDGTCSAKIYPPIYTPKTRDKQADLYSVACKMVTILEHEIVACPEMWFWVHDRWKDGRKRFGKEKKKKKKKKQQVGCENT